MSICWLTKIKMKNSSQSDLKRRLLYCFTIFFLSVVLINTKMVPKSQVTQVVEREGGCMRWSLKKHICLIAIIYPGSVYSQNYLGQTDLQKRLTPNTTITNSELVRKNDLIRLWPLNSVTTTNTRFIDDAADRVLNRPDEIINRHPVGYDGVENFNMITAHTCNSGDQRHVFAYFDGAAITSDETRLMRPLLSVVKPEHVLTGHPDFEKIKNENIIQAIKLKPLRDILSRSTSLVRAVDQNSDGQFKLQSTDYTIGGWFKPMGRSFVNSSIREVTLLKKYFRNQKFEKNTDKDQLEWKLFATGNMLYFQNNRDGSTHILAKYLTPTESAVYKKNYMYQIKPGFQKPVLEYYADVVERLNPINPVISKNLSGPIVPHASRKPIHPPQTPPVVPLPPGPPIVVPFPPNPYPPIIIPPIANEKEHTMDYDLKGMWWSTSLGVCWRCIKTEIHSDVWHYLSLSVHLNDPLGPYVDFYVIQDPQESLFGDKATMKNNFKKVRLEIGKRDYASRLIINPVSQIGRTESGCDKNTVCTQSYLQIGSTSETEGSYTGYMRGIYIAKKALRENAILDLAQQFRPIDACRTTYESNFTK